MESSPFLSGGVFVAADVHYLPSGGARAAAVLAADATFGHLLADQTELVASVGPYRRTATHAVPLLRGTSARPLYVTAAGLPRADAADLVRRMAGRHRLPDAVRRADTLARTGTASEA